MTKSKGNLYMKSKFLVKNTVKKTKRCTCGKALYESNKSGFCSICYDRQRPTRKKKVINSEDHAQ